MTFTVYYVQKELTKTYKEIYSVHNIFNLNDLFVICVWTKTMCVRDIELKREYQLRCIEQILMVSLNIHLENCECYEKQKKTLKFVFATRKTVEYIVGLPK